jgi:alkylhydroperoxidase family enzyme
MAPFLAPVDKPKSLLVRLVYFFTRRQFGKVSTPIAVFSARMPASFLSFYSKVSRLDRKLHLSPHTAMLVRQQVAGVNGCLFCMDISRFFALKKSPEDLPRIDALAQYGTSPLFTEAERAALDYATELTTTKHVEPETFARLARHYGEREICEIVWLVASEHLYNVTNHAMNIGSDGLCEIPPPSTRGRRQAVGAAR